MFKKDKENIPLKGFLIFLFCIFFTLMCVISFLASDFYLKKYKEKDKNQWNLMFQIEKDIQYIDNGKYYEKQKNDDINSYIVYLDDQIERPKKISYQFWVEKRHSIICIKEDGEIIFQKSIGEGMYCDEIPDDAYKICFSVYEEEEKEFYLLGEGNYKNQNTWASQYSFSVIGDSVSAYQGYITDGYLGYYTRDDFNVQSMWWAILQKKTGMTLCLNNSGGGTGVTELFDVGYPTAGNSERCKMLSQGNKDPDVIFILLGGNDALKGVSDEVIKESYKEMLNKISDRYPRAFLCICTYYKVPEEYKNILSHLNEILREIAQETGTALIDGERCDIGSEDGEKYFLDYNSVNDSALHVNDMGQEIYGDYIADTFLELDYIEYK